MARKVGWGKRLGFEVRARDCSVTLAEERTGNWKEAQVFIHPLAAQRTCTRPVEYAKQDIDRMETGNCVDLCTSQVAKLKCIQHL